MSEVKKTPFQISHSWWAKIAYGGGDLKLANQCLKNLGCAKDKRKQYDHNLISGMARGDALLRGALLMPIPKIKGGMEQILQDLPKAFREIHEALIIKLYSNFKNQRK
jgi:hypothetical protein